MYCDVENILVGCRMDDRLTRNMLRSVSQGFDEFMNVVLEDATEVYVKSQKPRREIGSSPSTASRREGIESESKSYPFAP